MALENCGFCTLLSGCYGPFAENFFAAFVRVFGISSSKNGDFCMLYFLKPKKRLKSKHLFFVELCETLNAFPVFHPGKDSAIQN